MGHAAEGRQSAGESCPFRMYGTTAMIWDRTNIICLGHSYSRQPIPCDGPFSKVSGFDVSASHRHLSWYMPQTHHIGDFS